MTIMRHWGVGVVALLALLLSARSAHAWSVEEFVGPFATWADLKRDFQAVGDGKADDTAALQRALDRLVVHRGQSVLFIPRGTYRITQTVKTLRRAHQDGMAITVIGENPATTVLLWDGEPGGTLFHWDAWYSKISRLTLDGAGKVGRLLLYGPTFSTYNETSDMIFRDAGLGLAFGELETSGQAENEVLRCHFLRCKTGLLTANWNSMDIWVWYSQFEDCDRAIHNGAGNWHVWESLFLRSKVSDLSIENLMVFSIVNNTSIGSKTFVDFSIGHTWGSPTTVTGNRVIDPTGDWAMSFGNAGPFFVADNQFRLSGDTRAVLMTWSDQVFVGNTYSKPHAVEEKGRFRRIDDRVVESEEISASQPVLPPTPQNQHRPVIDVVPGAVSAVIQASIDRAAKLKGQHPVVHLSAGRHDVNETLVVPAGCDMQIVGDGSDITATRLTWTGRTGGTLMRFEGPSRVTLRDVYLDGTRSKGLVIERADQAGGRIFADQLNIAGSAHGDAKNQVNLLVDGLDYTDVLLRALQFNPAEGTGVKVIGGPGAETASNQISIVTGASILGYRQYNVVNGGKLIVRGMYHEGSANDYQGILLTDRGTFSMDASRFSLYSKAAPPAIRLENFRGMFTTVTSIFTPSDPQNICHVDLTGDGSETDALVMGSQFFVYRLGDDPQSIWRNTAQPPGGGGFIGNNVNSKSREVTPLNYLFLDNQGDCAESRSWTSPSGPQESALGVDNATILRHLAPLRATRVWSPDETPDGVTDVQMHRVRIRTDGLPAVEIHAH